MSGKKIAVFIFRVGMVLALIGLISDSVSYSWVIIGYSMVSKKFIFLDGIDRFLSR